METNLIEREVDEISKTIVIIKYDDDCERANFFLKSINGLITKVNETFDPICDRTYKAWKEATGQRGKHLRPLEDVKKAVNNTISEYFREKEDLRLKLQAEAEEKARKEAERLLERANKAEAKGDSLKAESLRQEAVVKESLVPEIPQPRKQEGLSVRKVWKAKIINAEAVPHEFLDVNVARIEKVLNSTNGAMKIAGVVAYQESIVSSRKSWDE